MQFHNIDICLTCAALSLIFYYIRKRNTPLPPGPPGWPLIGNLLDMCAQAPYKALGTMSSKYGPVMSISVFGIRFVFINTFEAAKDLLEKKSATTYNRPHLTVCYDLVGWGNATGFLPYGDTLRKHHKLFGQHIRTESSLMAFHTTEEMEARQFVRNILNSPDDLIMHCRGTVASLTFKISHGYTVKGDSDPFMKMIDRAVHNLFETTRPGYYLVDLLPFLRYMPEWFPGCGFQKDVKQWRNMLTEAVNMPHKFVREQIAKNDAMPSFTSRLLQDGISPEDEEILKWVSFSMNLGGSDTLPAMLSAFFLAMTIYPEILRKAQAEVDVIVGNDRLPTMEDHRALPYVNAICKELLRWNVVIPLTAHVNTKDIIYEGYLIPKGSHLLSNIWFLLSDPATYPHPEIFDPERFLGDHQQPDPREACFGWGRRACLGSRLSDSIIFIHVAMALATLDVSRCVENGVELVPKREFEEGMFRRLKPFKCKITVRSKKAEELLLAEPSEVN